MQGATGRHAQPLGELLHGEEAEVVASGGEGGGADAGQGEVVARPVHPAGDVFTRPVSRVCNNATNQYYSTQ